MTVMDNFICIDHIDLNLYNLCAAAYFISSVNVMCGLTGTCENVPEQRLFTGFVCISEDETSVCLTFCQCRWFSEACCYILLLFKKKRKKQFYLCKIWLHTFIGAPLLIGAGMGWCLYVLHHRLWMQCSKLCHQLFTLA